MSRSAAFEAQSAVRDWLISQSPEAHRAVESALAKLERRLNAVKNLVRKNPEQTEGLRALVIDDDPTNRLLLRETLARWAIHPFEAGSDAESLAQIQ